MNWLFILVYSVFSSRSNPITALSILTSLEAPLPNISIRRFLTLTGYPLLFLLTPRTNGKMSAINDLYGFLVAIFCFLHLHLNRLLTGLLRRIFVYLFPSLAAILSSSPNGNPGADGGNEQPLNEPHLAPPAHGTENQQLPREPLPAPSVTTQARHPRRGAILDGDDPADGNYDPSDDDDREGLAADKPYENGRHGLNRVDHGIVGQHDEQVIGRHMALRPVGYPEGVIARNRPFRP